MKAAAEFYRITRCLYPRAVGETELVAVPVKPIDVFAEEVKIPLVFHLLSFSNGIFVPAAPSEVKRPEEFLCAFYKKSRCGFEDRTLKICRRFDLDGSIQIPRGFLDGELF